MNSGKIILGVTAATVALLYYIESGRQKDDLANGGLNDLPPRAIGSNAIKCTVEELGEPIPQTEVRLHIPSTIFADLATHKSIECPGQSCVATIVNQEDQYAPTASFNSSSINWRTPLDIDLAQFWNNDTKLLIRIILDGSNIQFFHPLQSGSPDWSQAVRQGDEGNGMFYCLSPVLPDPLTGKQSITLRVEKLTPTVTGTPSIGGLNIGILVPDPNNSQLSLPIYIDPQIHNNG